MRTMKTLCLLAALGMLAGCGKVHAQNGSGDVKGSALSTPGGAWYQIAPSDFPPINGSVYVFADGLFYRIEGPTLKANEGYQPLDVAPKEWDGPEHQLEGAACIDSGFDPTGQTSKACGTLAHHIGCEDKSLFLLQSQDGKWHCLALAGSK